MCVNQAACYSNKGVHLSLTERWMEGKVSHLLNPLLLVDLRGSFLCPPWPRSATHTAMTNNATWPQLYRARQPWSSKTSGFVFYDDFTTFIKLLLDHALCKPVEANVQHLILSLVSCITHRRQRDAAEKDVPYVKRNGAAETQKWQRRAAFGKKTKAVKYIRLVPFEILGLYLSNSFFLLLHSPEVLSSTFANCAVLVYLTETFSFSFLY